MSSAAFPTATVAVAWWLGRPVLGRDLELLAAVLFAWDVGQIQAAHFGSTESALLLIEMLFALVAAGYVLQSLSLTTMSLLSACLLGVGLAVKATGRHSGTPRVRTQFSIDFFYYRALLRRKLGYHLVGVFANAPNLSDLQFPQNTPKEVFGG